MLSITSDLNIPYSRKKAGADATFLAFRFLVAVDVEGFSRRSASEQAKVQDDLEYVMSAAAAKSKLDRKNWYRQLGGDGELAVLPSATDGLRLVADYPRQLARMLAEINDRRAPEARLRVRVAIHHGAVSPGRFGPIGMAPIVISRLLDAPMLRQQLRQRNDLDLVLIVSATVYDEVIQSRFHGLDPDAFARVGLKVKGKTYVGYLHQEGSASQIPVPSVITSAIIPEDPSPPTLPGSFADCRAS